MVQDADPRPDWEGPFLAALHRGDSVAQAIRLCEIHPSTAYYRRRANARFAADWARALRGAGDGAGAGAGVGHAGALNGAPKAGLETGSESGPQPETATGTALVPLTRSRPWRIVFLEVLGQTSNVCAAAQAANVPPRAAYKARRKDPVFARQWREALFEGYEHLEMEVLAQLRGQHDDRRIDVPNAIRQLATHRQTIAEMRTAQQDEDEEAVIASINDLIDRMRGAEPASDA